MNPKSVLFFAAAAAFASVASPLQAKIDRVVEKTFNVSGTGTLRIETSGGSVKVVPGSGNQVKIVAKQRIRADSDAEADELLKDLDLRFDQSGDNVSVYSRYKRERLGFSFGSWPPVNVNFEAIVPASFLTDLRTSGGSVEVGSLQGDAKIHTSGGSIRLGAMGGKVAAESSGGSISLEAAGGDVDLETSGGSITTGAVTGSAELSTSGGSIRIAAVGGRIRAETSGGSITTAVVGPLKADSVLETSGGGIHVQVDKTAAFRLDAATSGGRVEAEGLTITLEASGRDRTKLVGTVNGGGPLLKLRTSGGNIDIETR